MDLSSLAGMAESILGGGGLKIQIIGADVPDSLEDTVRQALAGKGLEVEIENITDQDQITALGIAETPAVAVNGNVVASGAALESEIMGVLGNFMK